jgi:surfeit locus 1 family protein
MTSPFGNRRWIVVSVLTAVAIGAMVELGFWQLRRMHSVRADNDRVRARLALPASNASSLLARGFDPSAAAYRRVTVEGRYEGVSEVLVRNRSLDGQPGSHVLTPLRMKDGRGVLIDRGWIPLDLDEEEEEAMGPPVLVDVRVTGVLFPSEKKGAFGPTIPPGGRLTAVARIDVERLAKQLEYPVVPLYLRLGSQTPPQSGELPVPPGPPDLSEGPHLSYAVQWFLFATVAAAVYAALLRREMKRPKPREGSPEPIG